jgi:hypothetical protein
VCRGVLSAEQPVCEGVVTVCAEVWPQHSSTHNRRPVLVVTERHAWQARQHARSQQHAREPLAGAGGGETHDATRTHMQESWQAARRRGWEERVRAMRTAMMESRGPSVRRWVRRNGSTLWERDESGSNRGSTTEVGEVAAFENERLCP